MTTQRKTILAATKKAPPGGDYVWDGKGENNHPLTREEMQKGVEAYRKKRGRPVILPGNRRRLANPHGCGFAASGEKVSGLVEEAWINVMTPPMRKDKNEGYAPNTAVCLWKLAVTMKYALQKTVVCPLLL